MNRLLSPMRPLSRRPLQHTPFATAFHPPPPVARRFPTLRRPTSTVGPNKSGFIDVAPGESLLYFDNVFPLKTAVYDLRYLVMRVDKVSLEARIQRQCIPPTLRSNVAPIEFSITGIIPRLKDGGAFLKFTSSKPAEVERMIQEYLKEKTIKPWFAPFTRVRAFLVQGKPWLEDLYRFPSSQLKIEFVPVKDGGSTELSQEALYALFRRFGKIADITVPPPGSKDLPKSAVMQFPRMRSATAARNCLHGLQVPEMTAIAGKEGGVALRIFYIRTIKTHWVRDWLMNHPRIVLPAVAAILATITVSIFDPIRTWFIQAKITHSLDFSGSKYWGWLKDNTIGRFVSHHDLDDISALWDERKESIERINGWLQESEETFIVVQGPRGSGKREVVIDTVLKNRKNVLIIDCEPIHEAHGDSATIAAAAAQVGYRPVFSWMNSISSLMDLAAQGTIGASAGFSQTLENQFNKILQNTGTGLKRVALSARSDGDKDASMSDDEYLAAHPETRPVVVIDNFLHTADNYIIYDRLADWAALLVSANVAHVIFLTNDISFSKSLSRSLPDRVFRAISLGDARPESAKRYVLAHIDNVPPAVTEDEKFNKELEASITALGGRLTDLEFLARRIKLGESPGQAVKEIIETSAMEVLKLHLAGSSSGRWTGPQAWLLVKHLSKHDIGYNQVLLTELFSDNQGEEALQALEHAEMISIISKNGRPHAVKPGKPVYRAAFQRLVGDHVLVAKMELTSQKAVVKALEAKMKAAEEELEKIVPLGKGAGKRADYLFAKMVGWQKEVEGVEKDMGGTKKVLLSEQVYS